MTKFDVIVSWPDNCDYPVWRKQLANNYFNHFNQVIIVITKTNSGYDYSDFIMQRLSGYCAVVRSFPMMGGEDWRNVAVNQGLSMSCSDWVWFTEQDFFIRDGFWEDLEEKINKGNEVISYYDNYRMHPCCIFAHKNVINKTSKNFGIVEGKLDHFGVFQKEVDEMFNAGKIEMDYIEDRYCEHLNGLSHNWFLLSSGGKPNYGEERFKKYIEECLNCGVELHKHFKDICGEYLGYESIS